MEFSIHTSKTHTWNPWSHQYLFLDSRPTSFTYVYAKFFWHCCYRFWGPHRIRNNLYDFFFRKVVFSTLHWHRMGGRTFFESIPSNILTMILIGHHFT
jgi:hypothetical protein